MTYPIVVTTFPKSGTYIVKLMLAAVARERMTLRGICSFSGFGWNKLRWPIDTLVGHYRDAVLPDRWIVDHLACDDEWLAEFTITDARVVFVYRDLRDVAVSHCYHIENPSIKVRHPQKSRYWDMHSHENRIRAVINGYRDVPSLRWRWEQFAGWLKQPWVLPIRYEDLRENLHIEAERLLDHIGWPLNLADQMVEGNQELLSPTFRAGRIGDWENEFTPELVDLFKDQLGDHLIHMGYEEDIDW